VGVTSDTLEALSSTWVITLGGISIETNEHDVPAMCRALVNSDDKDVIVHHNGVSLDDYEYSKRTKKCV